MNRSANRLPIVTTNLDGFSLANHRRFAKFAKLSRYTVLPRKIWQISSATGSAYAKYIFGVSVNITEENFGE